MRTFLRVIGFVATVLCLTSAVLHLSTGDYLGAIWFLFLAIVDAIFVISIDD